MAWCIPTVHPAYVLHGGDKSPIRDVIATDMGKAWKIANEGVSHHEDIIVVFDDKRNPWTLEKSFKAALDWMRHWRRVKPVIGVDVESSSLNYFDCSLYSVALASAYDHVAVAFTLRDLVTLPWEMQTALEAELTAILADPEITKVYHNGPFDRSVLHRKGFAVRGKAMDTMALSHLVQPDIPKDLGFVGQTYLEVGPWKVDHDGNKMANTKDIYLLLLYNGRDSLYTTECLDPILAQVTQRGMSQNLVSWQMAFADLSLDMQLAGLPINYELRRHMGMNLLKDLMRLERGIREYLSWPDFNPMSDDHKRQALFSPRFAGPPWNLGLIPGSVTKKTKRASTSYKSIIDDMEHPFVKMLVAYIENRQAYAIQYKESVDNEVWKLSQIGWTEELVRVKKEGKPGAYQRAVGPDGRLHPKWNPAAQQGTRQTSNPNVQNQKEIHRPFFEAPEGRAFVGADKDQLELRLVAARAGVEALLKEIAKEGDPHSMTAARVYGEEFWRKGDEERTNIRKVVKNVTYAGVYLAGWLRVWRTCRENKRVDPELRAKMTKELVRHVHTVIFHQLYREINEWHQDNVNKVVRDGYMEIPPLGRRRYCPSMEVPATKFANWSIQPVGSDIVTMEMCIIQDELKRRYHGRAFIINHGHDACYVECDKKDAEDVAALVNKVFGRTPFEGPKGTVYLTAEAKIGHNLLEVK